MIEILFVPEDTRPMAALIEAKRDQAEMQEKFARLYRRRGTAAHLVFLNDWLDRATHGPIKAALKRAIETIRGRAGLEAGWLSFDESRGGGLTLEEVE